MRVIGASILAFEAIVVVLAIPVAIALADVDAAVAAGAGGALVLLCVVVAGSLRRPWGFAAGWVVQVLLVLTGFVVPAMFFVGGLFAALWWIGLTVGRRGEQLHAERWSEVDDPRPAPPESAG